VFLVTVLVSVLQQARNQSKRIGQIFNACLTEGGVMRNLKYVAAT